MITKCKLQHLKANVIRFKQINGFFLHVKTIRNIAREKTKIKQKMIYFL